MGAERVLHSPAERTDKAQELQMGGKTGPDLRTVPNEKYSKLYKYSAFDVFVAVWSGISDWIGEYTVRGWKASGRTLRAFWGAIWNGSLFPLKVTISYGNENKVMRSVFAGRLLAVTVVTLTNGIRLALIKHKAYVPFLFLFGIWFVTESSLVIDAAKLSIVAILPYFSVLGFWKAREYKGMKLFLVGKMNEASKEEDAEAKCD